MKHIFCLTLALALLFAAAAVFAEPYTDNADGTVTDLRTGLIWQQSDDGVARSWQGAIDYCSALSLAEKSDWRLPTIKELFSISDLTRLSPSADPVFSVSDVYNGEYWSSTTDASYPVTAYEVNFIDGSYRRSSKDYEPAYSYARCVRLVDESPICAAATAMTAQYQRSGEEMVLAWQASLEADVHYNLETSVDGGAWTLLSQTQQLTAVVPVGASVGCRQ